VPDKALGSPCTTSASCGALTCVDGFCCGSKSCLPDESCGLKGHEGTCKLEAGKPCASDVACGSGLCADGVCCNTACKGQCEACAEAGSIGTCVPVKGAPRGGRGACDAGGGDVCKPRQCNGVETDRTTCAGWVTGSETECRPASCSSDGWLGPSKCDGAGNCSAPSVSSCGAYACAKDGCKKDCASDSDCASKYKCLDRKCQGGTICDGNKVVSTAGTDPPKDCTPYRCANGACTQPCNNAAECADGYICNSSGECTRPAEPPTPSCLCSLGQGSTEGGVAVAVGAALALARRRRRQGRR
jgi:hypothetical protein